MRAARSNPSAIRGKNSRIVTSLPSRFQTEPSSSPIAPAPMTRNFFGASSKQSASVLLTMVLPSNLADGSSIGTLPVAMTMFLVSISCVSPLEDFTETFPGAVIVPIPSSTITLFVFINWRTPPVSALTTLSLRFCIVDKSTRGLSRRIPCLAASFFAKTK